MAKKKRGKKKLDIKKGALHEQLGIAEGKTIPVSKLEQLKNSENPLTRKRSNLALVARKWNASRGGRRKKAGRRNPLAKMERAYGSR